MSDADAGWTAKNKADTKIDNDRKWNAELVARGWDKLNTICEESSLCLHNINPSYAP